MIIFLTIFQYLIQAVVDLMDKFLISAQRLEPVKYTFYTVVTGLVLLFIWPWNYYPLPAHFIFFLRRWRRGKFPAWCLLFLVWCRCLIF